MFNLLMKTRMRKTIDRVTKQDLTGAQFFSQSHLTWDDIQQKTFLLWDKKYKDKNSFLIKVNMLKCRKRSGNIWNFHELLKQFYISFSYIRRVLPHYPTTGVTIGPLVINVEWLTNEAGWLNSYWDSDEMQSYNLPVPRLTRYHWSIRSIFPRFSQDSNQQLSYVFYNIMRYGQYLSQLTT